MASRPAVLSPTKPSDKLVRQQLSRILASHTFSQVERLKRFVSFIVGETVSGRGGDLKEYVIGVQVFGKEPSFDPRTDPIVRVQARRLRTRLARYYRGARSATPVTPWPMQPCRSRDTSPFP